MRNAAAGIAVLVMTVVAPAPVLSQQVTRIADPAPDSAALNQSARHAMRQYLHKVAGHGYISAWPPTTTLEAALQYLEETLAVYPGDDWVLGHVVGMNLSTGNADRAYQVAMECQGTRWWCLELRGFVLHTLGRTVEAEAAYNQAVVGMPVVQRCQRRNLRWLLNEQGDRRPYADLDCRAAEEVGRRLWWLADPLHIVPGNERYVAHRARWTGLQLHMHEMAMMSWFCGETHQDGVVAVGWPLQSWMYELGSLAHVIPPGDRFVPTGSVVRPVLEMSALDWRFAEHRKRELYNSPWGPFHRLGDFQHASFLRGSTALALAALDPAGSPVADGTPLRAGLALSRDEHDSKTVVTDSGTAGPFRFRTAVSAEPQLVSIEAYRMGGGGAVRTRFGAAPPTLDQHAFGISDLLLFAWADTIAEDLEAVFPHMLPTTRLTASADVGVFWEVYGVPPDGTVRVSLTAVPASGGLLRRAGAALGLGRRDGIAITWVEEREVRPVAGRTLQLDLSDLRPGTYTLRLSVATARSRATTERTLEVLDS